MQVICGCGKKLFFADPNEEQICDRCGQKVRAGGAPPSTSDRPPERKRPGIARPLQEELPPTPSTPTKPSRQDAELMPIRVASERRPKLGRFGCALVLILAIGVAALADYLLHPPGPLACGHRGKEFYLFGLVNGHSCPGLEALRYLDKVRRTALAQAGDNLPRSFEELVSGMPELTKPKGIEYEFDIAEDGALLADPIEGRGLFHYRLERDGTVRCEESSPAGPTSTQTGSFRK